jgi:acyl-CoA thioester hydrolase
MSQDKTRKYQATTQVRVRYAETDAMGVAYHANYLIWFEQARTELLRLVGYPYSEMERDGFLLPVSAFQARFIQPSRYDDLLTIATTLAELRSRQLILEYEVFGAQAQLLAVGSTTHVVLDRETSRPTRVPRRLLELLQDAA